MDAFDKSLSQFVITLGQLNFHQLLPLKRKMNHAIWLDLKQVRKILKFDFHYIVITNELSDS